MTADTDTAPGNRITGGNSLETVDSFCRNHCCGCSATTAPCWIRYRHRGHCLAIASERPDLHLTACDVSASTFLAITQNNAQYHSIGNVEFLLSDWFADLPPHRYRMMVANHLTLQRKRTCNRVTYALSRTGHWPRVWMVRLPSVTLAETTRWLEPGGLVAA